MIESFSVGNFIVVRGVEIAALTWLSVRHPMNTLYEVSTDDSLRQVSRIVRSNNMSLKIDIKPTRNN